MIEQVIVIRRQLRDDVRERYVNPALADNARLAAPLLLLPNGQDREAHEGVPEIYPVRAGQFGRDTGILCDAGRTILAALVAAQPIRCTIDVRR